MSLRLRLLLLIGALVVSFVVSLSVLHTIEAREFEQLLTSTRLSKSRILHRWLEMNSAPLNQFSRDYSQWTEMVDFVKSGDRGWAKINIEDSLANFRACAAWVYEPGGALVYAAYSPVDAGLSAYEPAPRVELLARAQPERFTHFFAAAPVGIIEVHGSPVHFSEDNARTGTPLGWFYVARLWDDSVLSSLSEFLGAKVELVANAPDPGHLRSEDTICLSHVMQDVQGGKLRILHADAQPVEFSMERDFEELKTLVYVSFGGATLLLLSFCLRFWVLKPLERLGTSLATSDPSPLNSLLRTRHELGRLARLVADSFNQRKKLEREIEDRKRAEAAYLRSETILRQTMEERASLGRNLHDGVIQSLYAAGMGLGTIKLGLRKNPDQAEAKLEQTRLALNEIIRDVRNFITGLEPEALRNQSFPQAVQALAEQMRSIAHFEADLDIDEEVAHSLSIVQRAHALQIIREAFSNALRHGSACRISVRLACNEGRAEIEIRDDGTGFDAASVMEGGKGLANLSDRAQDLGAELRLESKPGNGTVVHLLFPLPPR